MHQTYFDWLSPEPGKLGSVPQPTAHQTEVLKLMMAEHERLAAGELEGLGLGADPGRMGLPASEFLLGTAAALTALTAFEAFADSAPLEPLYIEIEPDGLTAVSPEFELTVPNADATAAGETAFDAIPAIEGTGWSLDEQGVLEVEAPAEMAYDFDTPPPDDYSLAPDYADAGPVGDVGDIHRTEMIGAGNDMYHSDSGAFFDAGSGFTYIPGEG
ncbi:MAG: hypothetical protein ACYTGZ_15685, partial [Planctomycetota bacterium]